MMNRDAPRIDGRTARRINLLVGASHGFTHVYQLVLPPLYPVLGSELDLTYTELGMLTSAMALSFGLSQIVMGPLSDRFGRKWLILGGQFLFATATAMCGLASTFGALLLLQVLGGMGGSVLHPVGVALITDVTRADQRGKAMGIHGSGGMLGTAFAPITMVYLTVFVNWRFAMIVVGLLGMIFVPLIARYLVEPPREETGRSEESGTKENHVYPFSAMVLIMLLAVWITRSVSNRAYQAFLPTFLVSRYELSLELSGVFVTLFWIFAAVAWLIGGYLTDRYNHYAILWLSYLFTAVSLAVMLFARPGSADIIIYANFFLLGMFSFLGAPAFFAIYSEGIQKARSGTFYSLGFTVAFTVSSVVPGAMGWITDHFNAAASFYPALVLVITALIIVPILRRVRSRA
ncbi:MAG: MFS transporter [Deltaproteobacteria bacterium]|nr:MFS transporter [Deltaproteobacteria bacterium]